MAYLNNPILEDAIKQKFQGGMGGMQPLGGVPPAQPAPTGTPQPDMHVQVTHTADTPSTLAPAAPPPRALATPKTEPIGPSQNEQTLQGKFNDVSTHGSGISQIHNPIGRGLLTALDAVGSGLFPRIASVIPGTQAHHEQVLGQTEGALKHEQTNRKNTNEEQEQAARATNLEQIPEVRNELGQAKNELEAERNTEVARRNQAGEDIKRAQNEGQRTERERTQELNDRKAGYRRNADGELETIPYEEMTPEQQVTHDLKSSQRELADATAMLRKAQAEKNPQGQTLAMQRLDIANRRLQLSQQIFNARYQGVGPDNQPLAGSVLTDDNRVVPPVNAHNVLPTTSEINKGDLAKSAVDRVAEMRDILKKRPDLFGPGNGRMSAFQMAIGSQDPQAQKFLAASKYLADHSAALFGGRGEYIQKSLSQLSENKINVPALTAAIDEAEKTAKPFAKAGTRRTVGSKTVEDEKPKNNRPPLSSFENK